MSSTRGSTRSSTSGHSHSNKKNRGPKHGHGNKGKGGGSSALSGNPTGMTFDQAMKIYGVDNKTDLQARMQYNPAETTGFYNLIDDSKTTNTNNMTTNTMNDKDWLTHQYKTYFNRDPVFGGKLADGREDPGDADYWLGQLAGGTSKSDIVTHLNTSPEANELRQNIFDLAEDPNAPTDVIERHNQARANTPLGGSAMAEAKKNYTGRYQDFSKTNNTNNDILQEKITDTISKDTDTKNTPAGLTLDDLNSWWEGKQNNQPNQFDQFKEFMGMLGDIPGMGGAYGYGYPNMGYGGGAPGGVAAANPYGNMMSFMNAFKNMGSGGSDSKLANSSLTK